MPRLNVSPRDNVPVGEWLQQQLRREAEERRTRRPLSRTAVVERLRRAIQAAAAGNAAGTVVQLLDVIDESAPHGLHGRGRDLFREVEAVSGRFTDALGRDEPPHASIVRRLEALLVEVEGDDLADTSPRAVIHQAADRFGLDVVLNAAGLDDFRQGIPAGQPAPERPAKSLRTVHAAALRLLEAPEPAEAA